MVAVCALHPSRTKVAPGNPWGEMGIDRDLPPGGRVRDIGQLWGLPCPEPMFVAVHLCARLIRSDDPGIGDPMLDHFIKRSCPVRKTVQ